MPETPSPRFFRRPVIPPISELAQEGNPADRASKDLKSNATVSAEELESAIRHIVSAAFDAITEGRLQLITADIAVAVKDVCDSHIIKAKEMLARAKEEKAALQRQLAQVQAGAAEDRADTKGALDYTLGLQGQLAQVTAQAEESHSKHQKWKAHALGLEHRLDLGHEIFHDVEKEYRAHEKRASWYFGRYHKALVHTTELERRIEEMAKGAHKSEVNLKQQVSRAVHESNELRVELQDMQRCQANLLFKLNTYHTLILDDEKETEALLTVKDFTDAEKATVKIAGLEWTARDLNGQLSCTEKEDQTVRQESTNKGSSQIDAADRDLSSIDFSHAFVNLGQLAGPSRAANVTDSSTPFLKNTDCDSGIKFNRGRASPSPTKPMKRWGKAIEMGKEDVVVEGTNSPS